MLPARSARRLTREASGVSHPIRLPDHSRLANNEADPLEHEFEGSWGEVGEVPVHQVEVVPKVVALSAKTA